MLQSALLAIFLNSTVFYDVSLSVLLLLCPFLGTSLLPFLHEGPLNGVQGQLEGSNRFPEKIYVPPSPGSSNISWVRLTTYCNILSPRWSLCDSVEKTQPLAGPAEEAFLLQRSWELGTQEGNARTNRKYVRLTVYKLGAGSLAEQGKKESNVQAVFRIWADSRRTSV